MGFFKDERVDSIENDLVVVKSSVVALSEREENLTNENKLLKGVYSKLEISDANKSIEIDNLKSELHGQKNEINTLKQYMEKLLSVLNKEDSDQKEEKVIILETDGMISDGWYSYLNACKAADVGVTPTELKYYLSEYGILVKNINHSKNTFNLSSKDINNYPQHIKDHCKIHKNNLVFDEWIIGFIVSHKDDIKKASDNMKRKSNEYESTKNKLERINYNNYREEIKRICNGDTSKYVKAYDILIKKYPSFYSDYAKCVKDNSATPRYAKYGVTKLEYICSFMNEGNYFLKIVCELFA